MAPLAGWIRQHSEMERALAVVLGRYFAAQRGRILSALQDFESVTPAVVPQIFHPAEEHKRLMLAVRPPLLRTMATGAATQLAWIRKRKPGRPKADDLAGYALPEDVKRAILAELNDLEGYDYWQRIQATTEANLTSVINQGVNEGWNGYTLKKNIEKALGYDAKIRSAAIARTETTGAFNAGHQATYDALAADGTISGKTWLATLDRDCRAEHAALHEVTVGAADDFNVGGELAPYPGHPGLSAGQRVRCRCVTVAAFPEGS
jgi:hypothetical protein